MTVAITPFLRTALAIDATASGVSGLLFTFAASFIADWMALPVGLVFWIGIFMFPWTALLATAARQAILSRVALMGIIAVNALWVVASFGIMLGGVVDPTTLGIAFITVQAIGVAVFAELQFVGMRRASA